MDEEEEPVVVSISDNSSSDINHLTTKTANKVDFNKYFKPNAILSGEQLYNATKRAEKTIPPKGGHKDFEPDGTWLQGKKMDMFYSTMENLLEEPRTERLGSLLVGVWNPEKNLVEYKRDARKFWAKMGFVDEKRKWLYPEEALYLMEIKSMEVYDNDVPLSLQEAYRIFIGTTESRNQYQVYAHLRRLGYSVIQHQGRSDTSQYERELKLNQYVKENQNKKRKICKNLSANTSIEPERDNNNVGSATAEENLCKKLKIENASKIKVANHDNSKGFPMSVNSSSNIEKNLMGTSGNLVVEENSDSKNTNANCKPVREEVSQNSKNKNDTSSTFALQESNCEKMDNVKDCSETEPEDSLSNTKFHQLTAESKEISLSSSYCDLNKNPDSDSTKMDITQMAKKCNSWFDQSNKESCPSSDNSGRLSPNFLSDIKKLQVLNDEDDEKPCKMFMYPEWDFEKYNLPNIASLARMTCSHPTDSVTVPLFGESLPEGNLDFNVQEYRETVMNLHKYHRASRGQTEVLEFSFQNKFRDQKKAAKNWGEYKKICELETEDKMSVSPLKFLWEGEVTPLVAAEDATSTAAILKKLQVIKHSQLHVCSMAKRLPDYPDKWPIVYDVYQPNSNFKKTNPGLPYFRVCVCGVDEEPPTISDVLHFSRYFADDVPMNWAVVDNGEISFYIFRGVSIPERP